MRDNVMQEAELLLARETTSFGPYDEEYRAMIRALMECIDAGTECIASHDWLRQEVTRQDARIASLEAEIKVWKRRYWSTMREAGTDPIDPPDTWDSPAARRIIEAEMKDA